MFVGLYTKIPYDLSKSDFKDLACNIAKFLKVPAKNLKVQW